MLATLSLPRFPVDLLERVLLDGRILCPETLAQWNELFLMLVGYRAARWKAAGKPDFAAWFTEGIRRSQWSSQERRTEVCALIDDPAALERRTQEILQGIILESSRVQFWVNLSISSGVNDGALWFEVLHAHQAGSHRVSLGAGDEKPDEALSLKVEVREDSEAVVQIFGPMLSALCFGRALLGVHLPSRPAKVNVTLQLPEEAEHSVSAAQALREMSTFAETTAPNLLWFS